MIEYEELRLRLLESEKTVKKLLLLTHLKKKSVSLKKKAVSLIFGMIWKTAKK